MIQLHIREDVNQQKHCCENLQPRRNFLCGDRWEYSFVLARTYMFLELIIYLIQYRVIRNDCLGFNSLSYTIHLRVFIFLFSRTTLQVFVTYLSGALYVHPL